MEWAGILSGAVGTLVAVLALYFSRKDRQGDKLEALTARVGRLETQMEPFWAAVQADMIKILHHPWPERQRMDHLLDLLDPEKPGNLSPAERTELQQLLRQIISSDTDAPPPFPISPEERVTAVWLLRTMDITRRGTVGAQNPAGPDGQEETPEERMVRTANALMDRVERALRAYRWVLGGVVLVVLLLAGGYFQVRSIQSGQHQAAVTACRSGNDYRAGDELGWEKAMALALGPHPNAQARQFAGSLLTYIHQLDAPRDCSAV